MKFAYVTTEDNPFDPFDDFENWKAFDEENGYYTMNYLMRIAKVSLELSDEEYCAGIVDAVDEIVAMNLTGNYKKVEREVDGITTDSD